MIIVNGKKVEPSGGGASVLTGDAAVTDVADGKFFYADDPNEKLEGTSTAVDTTITTIGANLLTANQSNAETDTTGIWSQDGTLTRDTSEHWEGTASFKLVSNNVDSYEGAFVEYLSPLLNTDYVASFYIKGSGTLICMANEDEATIIEITLTETWTRYSCTFNSVDYQTCGIIIYTDVQQAATFYIDGMKLEIGSSATAWSVGGDAGQIAATAGTMISPATAYVNGVKITGTKILSRTSMAIEPNTIMYPMEAIAYVLTELIPMSGDLADLPTDIKAVAELMGSNTITGGLSDIPDSVTTICIINNTTITGALADLPAGLTFLRLSGCTELTGLLSALPVGLTRLWLTGCANVSGVYSPNATIDGIALDGTGMSAADTDNTLIALNAITSVTGAITTAGNRTATSDAAVTALQGKGWTVDGA